MRRRFLIIWLVEKALKKHTCVLMISPVRVINRFLFSRNAEMPKCYIEYFFHLAFLVYCNYKMQILGHLATCERAELLKSTCMCVCVCVYLQFQHGCWRASSNGWCSLSSVLTRARHLNDGLSTFTGKRDLSSRMEGALCWLWLYE